MIHSFKDLIVWQKSVVLAQETYSLARQLPTEEQFGLKSQLQRSSISISSNIAEDSRRGSKKEFVRFLWIAHGSCAELETQLILVNQIYALDIAQLQKLLDEIQKMLTRLIQVLSTNG